VIGAGDRVDDCDRCLVDVGAEIFGHASADGVVCASGADRPRNRSGSARTVVAHRRATARPSPLDPDALTDAELLPLAVRPPECLGGRQSWDGGPELSSGAMGTTDASAHE